MIVVTGTTRSGTSMWMQVLRAAGLPVLGEAFPAKWGESIRDENPRGFYESPFRSGVFYATNPDPKTGIYVHPDASRRHAVKIFIPGLLRTELGFLDHVIATMRPWREYERSGARLRALEASVLEQAIADSDRRELYSVAHYTLPAWVRWWRAYYALIRDVAVRRYRVHLATMDRVLADPAAETRKVLRWIAADDVDAGARVIEPSLRRQRDVVPSAEEHPLTAALDELYRRVHEFGSLTRADIDRVNDANREIESFVAQAHPDAAADRRAPRAIDWVDP